jgi:hypothetical protein
VEWYGRFTLLLEYAFNVDNTNLNRCKFECVASWCVVVALRHWFARSSSPAFVLAGNSKWLELTGACELAWLLAGLALGKPSVGATTSVG